MDVLIFELWSNYGEETFSYVKKFFKNPVMIIPSKYCVKLFFNLMN